ncbi:MAG: cytochrome c biogenesis protein CcdA [Rectinemataceae bacterium]|nr:cytochrome c biogenesis protein CcdA [Spirochaetaceae bacterium]
MSQPGILAAFAAGIVSFVSPCVLPLLPAYLSMLSGIGVKALGDRQSRGRLLGASLLFAAGFTLTFTALGVLFSGGMMFTGAGSSVWFGRIAGIVVILLGLNIMFDFIALLNADTRLIRTFTGTRGGGKLHAFLLGLAFAAGWSPCIGPILASILLMAARNGNLLSAGVLLVTYSAGFAVPFIASALFFERLSPLLAFLKRHGNQVRIASGILLIVFGMFMLAGSVSRLSSLAAQGGGMLLAFADQHPSLARAIGSLFWIILAFLGFIRLRKARGTPNRPVFATVLTAAAMIALVLEASGMVSLVRTIGGWLTFSGI